VEVESMMAVRRGLSAPLCSRSSYCLKSPFKRSWPFCLRLSGLVEPLSRSPNASFTFSFTCPWTRPVKAFESNPYDGACTVLVITRAHSSFSSHHESNGWGRSSDFLTVRRGGDGA